MRLVRVNKIVELQLNSSNELKLRGADGWYVTSDLFIHTRLRWHQYRDRSGVLTLSGHQLQVLSVFHTSRDCEVSTFNTK